MRQLTQMAAAAAIALRMGRHSDPLNQSKAIPSRLEAIPSHTILRVAVSGSTEKLLAR